MSDPHHDPNASREVGGEAADTQVAAQQKTPSLNLPRMRGREGWGLAAVLAVILLLVVGLVALAPLWAPLLPWAAAPDAALATRLDRLDQAQQHSAQETAASAAAVQRLDRRVAALESKPAAAPSDIAELRQQIARLTDTAAELARRIDALDKAAHSQAAGDAAELALSLALLQIRDAVELGRPFAAAYSTLMTLAQGRADIAAAAAPLAEPAKSGVASRAVLAVRLRELDRTIVAAPADHDGDWTDQALARLKSLVTIRRINGAAAERSGSPEAVLAAAQRTLAGGDLDGAVAALDGLTGAAAAAARPWLGMAKERLAVEMALQRLDALLAARLGGAANAVAGGGASR